VAIAHLTQEERDKLREHGHPTFWEVTGYGEENVTVECVKCGEVLLELILRDEDDNG
jgi:hypothetical protein